MAKILIISLIFIIMLAGVSAYSEITDSVFAQANSFYEDKKYPEALGEYIKLEEMGIVSAEVYYNIGNCYFELGELGYSILYYLRAQRIEPADEDINNNLEFARQYMAITLEGVKINPVETFLENLAGNFTLNSLAWISSGLFVILILFISIIVYLGTGGPLMRSIGYVLAIVFIVTALMTTYKYRTDYLTQKGVIVASEANIFGGPDEQHGLEFTGSFGLVFEVERQENDYFLVMFENKRKGWIHKDLIKFI